MPDIVPVKTLTAIALAVAGVGLAGCSQMTKHSNTLVFATDTFGGLKVGSDANKIPLIEIGYSRQEGAIIPVLANTGAEADGDLVPCPASTIEQAGAPTPVDITNLEDCKFIATHDGVSQDSYSTLASFGGEAGADVDATGKTGGKVTIAQYFATGIAAQYLAITGGANVVQAGGDTKAQAEAAEAAAGLVVSRQQIAALKEQGQSDLDKGMAKITATLPNDTVAQADITALNALLAKVPACRIVGDISSYVGAGKKQALEDFLRNDRTACVMALGRKNTDGAAS